MNSFKRILLPTDFSETSTAAFQPAIDLARVLSAEIILAHVTSPVFERVDYGDLAKEIPSMEDKVHRYVLNKLEDMKEELAGEVSVRTVHKEGVAPVELMEIASENEVDMIVVASHGFTGSRYHVLGSVAEKLVRHAPCAVLTIRTEFSNQE